MELISKDKIKETLSRSKFSNEIEIELYGLYEVCENISDSKLFEYIPIKIVACFEAFFRCVYTEIMDDPRFRGRLGNVKQLKNTKFNFEILGAFQDNEISLADYLSIIIPCSSLDDINSTISSLLDIDFMSKIKNKTTKYVDLISSIEEIFNLRHIFCHEVPDNEKSNIRLELNKVEQYIKDSCDFIKYSDEIVREILYPNYPTTTMGMIKYAQDNLVNLESELEELVKKIRKLDLEGFFASNGLDYIDDWKKYREAKAKSEAKLCEDGSIYTLIYSVSLESTTREFIKELKNEYKYHLMKSN